MRRADIAIAGVNRTTKCNWGSWKSEAIVSRLTVAQLIELRRIRNWALGHMGKKPRLPLGCCTILCSPQRCKAGVAHTGGLNYRYGY